MTDNPFSRLSSDMRSTGFGEVIHLTDVVASSSPEEIPGDWVVQERVSRGFPITPGPIGHYRGVIGGMLSEPFSPELLELPVEMDVRPREFQLQALGIAGLRNHFSGVMRSRVRTLTGQALDYDNKRPDIGPDCE